MASFRKSKVWGIVFCVVCGVLAGFTAPAQAVGEIVSGPYSLTLRGGGDGDSGNLGVDGRVDFLNPTLNIHLFGTYDLLTSNEGVGKIDNSRYGGGVAVSHTFPARANIYLGTAVLNEMGVNFSHVYAGAKLMVTDSAFLTGAYGIGLGNDKRIPFTTATRIIAESADWLKFGGVAVFADGLKGNLSYYLTDPGGEKISGIEGEISYPLSENLTVGVRGSSDLTSDNDLLKSWQANAFVTYAFGAAKGRVIEVALDKNSPIAYPKIVRKISPIASAAGPSGPLTLSADILNPGGCSGDTTTFTASGGTPPYVFTTDDIYYFDTFTTAATSAQWYDNNDDYCSGTSIINVTVTDALGATASVAITVNGGAF